MCTWILVDPGDSAFGGVEIADDGVDYLFGNNVMTHNTMHVVCTVARVFVADVTSEPAS